MKIRHYLAVALIVVILQGLTLSSCKLPAPCDYMRIETCEPE